MKYYVFVKCNYIFYLGIYITPQQVIYEIKKKINKKGYNETQPILCIT